MKLCAALRSTHDLCVHAPTLSLKQRQIFTFTWDVGIGATGTGDQYHGATVRIWFLSARPGLTQEGADSDKSLVLSDHAQPLSMGNGRSGSRGLVSAKRKKARRSGP